MKSAEPATATDDSSIDTFDGPYDILRSQPEPIQPEPITLSLKQLWYTVQVPVKGKKETESKLLLNEVSTIFVPGTMRMCRASDSKHVTV